MKRIPARQRVLAGGLALAAGYWAVDSFTGGGEPTVAQAAPGPSATEETQWQDVAELIDRLTRTDHASVADEIDQLQRDLFQPTRLFEATFGSPPAEPAEHPNPDRMEAAAATFADRHQLTGVVLGHTPLAVIDGCLLPLNSDLDGYTLVEVRRESVVLGEIGSGRRVTLKLDQGPGNR